MEGQSRQYREPSPMPTPRLMMQKSRDDLENWLSNCKRKLMEWLPKANGDGFYEHLIQQMEERVQTLEVFLRDNPDHSAPLLPSTVAQKMQKLRATGTFSSAPNPFRPTKEELADKNHIFYQEGPNGRAGYPLAPGERVQKRKLILKNSPSDSALELMEQGEKDLEKTKEALAEKENSEGQESSPSTPPEKEFALGSFGMRKRRKTELELLQN